MNKLIIGLGVAGVALILVLAGLTINKENIPVVGGSWADAYSYQIISSDYADSNVLIKTQPGMIGSIALSSPSTGSGYVVLFDSASSTSPESGEVITAVATAYGSTVPIPMNLSFDTAFNEGLVVSVPDDFDGVFTIMYR